MKLIPSAEIQRQIDDRDVSRKVVGGGDVAAIVGVHPYKTGHDVWLEKLGLSERVENEAMYWGKKLEPVILDEYQRREGLSLTRFTFPDGFRRHGQHQWMGANLDALVVGRPVGVDAKTTSIRQSARWGDPGTDDIPEEALLQMQWYLAVVDGVERWDVAVLLGQEFRIYRILPNRELHAMLIEVCGEWWERYVLGKTPPPPDASLSARRMLERLYPLHGETLRSADELVTTRAMQYRQLDQQVDALIRERDQIRNEICAFIGEAAGVGGDGWKVSWRRTKDREDTQWEQVARWLAQRLQCDAAIFDEARRMFTETKPGFRRFLPTFSKD